MFTQSKRRAFKSRVLIDVILVSSSIAALTILHYFTAVERSDLHYLYRRLYYVPIIYGCFRFGLLGGMLSSVVVSVCYLPHILHGWEHIRFQQIDAIFEVALFNIIAVITGGLVELEKKQREKAVKAENEIHKAGNLKTIGELASGLAHEIRNPLTSIRGVIEILGNEFKDNPEKTSLVGISKKSIDDLNKLVTDFLDFARPSEIAPNFYDINELVVQSITLATGETQKKNAVIETNLTSGLPIVKIDGPKLKQVFINLILNGIEALDKNGRIEITTASDRDEHIRITFADNGRGIEEENMDNVFEPFFTTKEKGTGLGLSIAKRIVEDSGGSINVKSTKGEGATFTVLVPLRK